MNLRTQLIGFEGIRYHSYPDPLTGGDPWTIGAGHTGPEVRKGLIWTDEQVQAALTADIAEKVTQCRAEWGWFEHLNEPRQAVIVGMCFQMGMSRLKGFVNMLGSVRDGRYANAAEEMRQSRWARQTPKRAIRLAHQLETGSWN